MKKIIFLLGVFCFSFAWSSTPNKISFQSILRDSDDHLIKNETVSLRISLIEDNSTGKVVYKEKHQIETNSNGLASFYIGDGVTNNNFQDIAWNEHEFFIKVEVDLTGKGTNYKISHISQLMTVPYAFHSKTTEKVSAIHAQVEGETISIGNEEDPSIYINDDHQVLFFTKESDSTRTDLRKDIQLAPNVRLWGYSSEYHLDRSGVINLQAVDSASKPAIVWYTPKGQRKAAIVGHEFSGGHNKRHNHWSIETTNETGELHTRMEFPFDSSVICIETHSADFKVGDTGKLITTGPVYSYNSSKVGFGDKDWEVDGLDGNAKWEFYRADKTAEFLIHQGNGAKAAQLDLKSGDNSWELINDGDFLIKNNNSTHLYIDTLGKVGIGTKTPDYQLDVDGDINISSGSSYLSAGADYAEYFQCEAPLVSGDIVGINLNTGYTRKYQQGDVLLGIVSNDAGFIGNNIPSRDTDKNYVLVGIKGQLSVNKEQVIIQNRKVYTKGNL